jgi:acetyl/propionyl-CoA carboxylase alpha subunit
VEHPITEATCGVDLVKEQLLIAGGAKLSVTQDEIEPRGHAIECRINAEDPFKNFMPSPGTLTKFELPHHPWVRVDTACYEGYQILPFYDSLLAKLVVWGRSRKEAIERTKVALRHFKIEGVATTIPFHSAILEDQAFVDGGIYTTYVEQSFMKRFPTVAAELGLSPARPAVVAQAAGVDNGKNGAAPDSGATACANSEKRSFEVDVNQKQFKVAVVELNVPGQNKQARAKSATTSATSAARPRPSQAPSSGSGNLKATMHGLVKEILVLEGAKVEAGQKVMIFEAMKMESDVVADRSGVVQQISVKSGQTVDAQALLMVIGD